MPDETTQRSETIDGKRRLKSRFRGIRGYFVHYTRRTSRKRAFRYFCFQRFFYVKLFYIFFHRHLRSLPKRKKKRFIHNECIYTCVFIYSYIHTCKQSISYLPIVFRFFFFYKRFFSPSWENFCKMHQWIKIRLTLKIHLLFNNTKSIRFYSVEWFFFSFPYITFVFFSFITPTTRVFQTR